MGVKFSLFVEKTKTKTKSTQEYNMATATQLMKVHISVNKPAIKTAIKLSA